MYLFYITKKNLKCAIYLTHFYLKFLVCVTVVYLAVANAVLSVIETDRTQNELRGLLVVNESLWDDAGIEDIVPETL